MDFICFVNEFTKFCYLNNKEISQISNYTEELLTKSDKLIGKYEIQLRELNAFDSSDEMYDNISQINSNMDKLIDYLGENKDE